MRIRLFPSLSRRFGHGTEADYDGADHRHLARSGGSPRPRADDWFDLQRPGHLGAELLPWRRDYGGLKLDQAKRLKDLERENERLKKAVSELTLDKLILKEALEGKY